MTALSETEHIVQGFAAGGVDYVTKPIVLDEMFARIRVHLANARVAMSARLALDSAGSFLLAVNGAGAVVWATPQAGRLLRTAYPSDHDGTRLPRGAIADVVAAIREKTQQPLLLPASTDSESGRLSLSFLGAVGSGEFLFRLTSQDEQNEGEVLRRRFSLTAREAEVLLWIGRGKSNRDIGDILALSPRTVNKHLEGIYAKLGVENRASAAVMASRVLGQERSG